MRDQHRQQERRPRRGIATDSARVLPTIQACVCVMMLVSDFLCFVSV